MAPAARHPHHVVVGKRPRWPGLRPQPHQHLHPGSQELRPVALAQEQEVVGGVIALGMAGIVGGHLQRAVAEQLRHRHPPRLLVHHRAQFRGEDQGLGLLAVVDVQLHVVRLDRVQPVRGRVVRQAGVMGEAVGHIQPETVHAPVQPEPRHVQQRLLHRGGVEVQVRLPGQEVVQVILPPPPVPAPARAAEHRLPVVGRRAVGPRIGPDVPVGLGVAAAAAALLEPGVPVGGVGIDLVDDQLQPQRVGLGHQPVEVLERAEQRVDGAVVADVVAVVGHGR